MPLSSAHHCTSQPRTIEVFRFLGILDDARRHARKRVQMQSYKLPGGTEPLRTWWMYEEFQRTPDRPEVSSAQTVQETCLLTWTCLNTSIPKR